MIYEWLEANRKDIDILTSFLVTVIPIIMLYSESLGIVENTVPYCILTVIPIIMLYSESLGIVENTVPYCILMIILGIASHYASRIRGDGDVEYAKKKAKKSFGMSSGGINFSGKFC